VGFYPFRGQNASFTLKQSYHVVPNLAGQGRTTPRVQGAILYFCEEVGGHGAGNPRISERITAKPEIDLMR